LFAAFIVVVVFGSIQTSYQQPVQSSPILFPHDSKPFNVTMGKWLERYWIWLASIPEDVHPRGDTTGENCGTNQAGPIWYLDPPVEQPQPNSTTFYCEIPENKAILVPIYVGECDPTVLDNPTDSQISECAKMGNDRANIKFDLDGKRFVEIKGTSQSEEQYSLYRTASDFFNISFVENNIFEADSGTYRAQADGYFVILQPLPLGDHEMSIYSNRLVSEPGKKPTPPIDVSYNIKIVKNQNSSS
jgi:hypothetical protein